ncbi:MAG: hypothetical protein RLZZ106_1233, partial [Cyanobacteriota bacterium]
MLQALRWPLRCHPLRPLLLLSPFALWGTAMAAMKPLLDAGTPLQVACL